MTDTKIEKLTVTIKEVAEALSVSPSLVRKWKKLGKIKSVKLGASVRIPTSELQRLAEEGV